MDIQELPQRCKLILDNTQDLYEREQAIFRVYRKNGQGRHQDLRTMLWKLAEDVVARTNLVETSMPMIVGHVADDTVEQLVEEMLFDYDEFVQDQPKTDFEKANPGMTEDQGRAIAEQIEEDE